MNYISTPEFGAFDDRSQVIITGANPVGLSLALFLAQHEIAVTVLAAGSQVADDIYPIALHSSTLDLLARSGVSSALSEAGDEIEQVCFRTLATQDIERVPLSGERKTQILIDEQKLNAILSDAVAAHSKAHLVLGETLQGFRRTDDLVEVLSFDGTDETLRPAKYLIGTDGSSSTVRRGSGILLDSFSAQERQIMLVTDHDFTQDFEDLEAINIVSSETGIAALIKLSSAWLVISPVEADEDADTVLSDAAIQARLQDLIGETPAFNILQRELRESEAKIAETYQPHARVFLAGSAAYGDHPIDGLDTNIAIQDVYSLAGKIADALRGNSPSDQIIDAYDRQRRALHKTFVEKISQNTRQLSAESRDIDASNLAKVFAEHRAHYDAMLKDSIKECMGQPQDAGLVG